MRIPLQPVAPSIDDPIELLLACHDKVRHFANLAQRLRDHLNKLPEAAPVDTPAQEAAQAILRYFTVAAPLHHADEEIDLFPALRLVGTPELRAHVDTLTAEHSELGGLWQNLQTWLQDIAKGHAHRPPDCVDDFALRYSAHAQREEDEVYPSATHLSVDQLKRISQAMVKRRTGQTHSPHPPKAPLGE